MWTSWRIFRAILKQANIHPQSLCCWMHAVRLWTCVRYILHASTRIVHIFTRTTAFQTARGLTRFGPTWHSQYWACADFSKKRSAGKVVLAMWSIFAAIALCFFTNLSHGLYFHMGETEKKCFIEEIPDETMVIGEWSIQLLSIVPSLWCIACVVKLLLQYLIVVLHP